MAKLTPQQNAAFEAAHNKYLTSIAQLTWVGNPYATINASFEQLKYNFVMEIIAIGNTTEEQPCNR